MNSINSVTDSVTITIYDLLEKENSDADSTESEEGLEDSKKGAVNLKGISVIIPTPTGQIGILRNHTPVLTLVECGIVRVKQGDIWNSWVVYDGIAEVTTIDQATYIDLYTPIQVNPTTLVVEDELSSLETIKNEPLESRTGYSYRQRLRRAKVRTAAATEINRGYDL
jgi:F0F1-type ATP synthase epsilon subunit